MVLGGARQLSGRYAHDAGGGRAAATAVAFGYRKHGQILEPSGAVALAVILERAVTRAPEGATAVLLTGANIDPEPFARIIASQ